MWFDIIRKKIVNMQVVRDILRHFSSIFDYARSMPHGIKNSKFIGALSTYHYIQNNMYVIEWDEHDEERAPRVRETEAYVKKIEKILKELKEWYNSIPTETRIKSRNLLKEINKELNAAHSLFLDSDFVFDNNDNWGTYYQSTDTSTVNIPVLYDWIPDGEKELIRIISETLSHEFGHQASRSIDSSTRGDSFFEEMLAYLVENPNNKQRAFEGWLGHRDVKESVRRDKSGRKKEIYDRIKMSVQTGQYGDYEDKKLSNIIENLLSVHGVSAQTKNMR